VLHDLASLTKPLVTAPLALRHLELDADLAPWLGPVAAATGGPTVTARRLLSHSACLPPWLAYDGGELWRQLAAPLPWDSHPLLRRPTPREGACPACYSDLGYRLLAEALEAVVGQPWAQLGQALTGLTPAPWPEAPHQYPLPPGPDREAWARVRPEHPFPPAHASQPHDGNARAGMRGHAGFAADVPALKAWLDLWRHQEATRMALVQAQDAEGTAWGLGLRRLSLSEAPWKACLERWPLDGRCRVVEVADEDLPPDAVLVAPLPPAGPSPGGTADWWVHTGFTGPALFYRPEDRACLCLLLHRRGAQGEMLDHASLFRRRLGCLDRLL
jgi:CubicO group peptidase (beta-lactamase class C family)